MVWYVVQKGRLIKLSCWCAVYINLRKWLFILYLISWYFMFLCCFFFVVFVSVFAFLLLLFSFSFCFLFNPDNYLTKRARANTHTHTHAHMYARTPIQRETKGEGKKELKPVEETNQVHLSHRKNTRLRPVRLSVRLSVCSGVSSIVVAVYAFVCLSNTAGPSNR